MLKIIDVMYKEAIVELFNQGHDVDEIVGHLNLLNELKSAIPSANYAERQKPYITELMKLIIERALSNGNIAINEEVLGHKGSFIDDSIQVGIKWWRTPGHTRFRGAMAFIPNIAIVRNKIRDFFNKEHVAIHKRFKTFNVLENYSMYDYLNMILNKNFPFFDTIKRIIHDIFKLVASIYEGNPEFINMEANRVELELYKENGIMYDLDKMKATYKPEDYKTTTQHIERGTTNFFNLKGGALHHPLLIILLLDLSEKKGFNEKVFIEKAKEVLHLMQEDLAFELLHEIIHSAKATTEYTFTPTNINKEKIQGLEDALSIFSDSELSILSTLTKHLTLHKEPPEEFSAALGDTPYFLSGEGPLHGVADEPLDITEEERESIERGGVSMGAVVFLYVVSLSNH
jgi:hypothetical protein